MFKAMITPEASKHLAELFKNSNRKLIRAEIQNDPNHPENPLLNLFFSKEEQPLAPNGSRWIKPPLDQICMPIPSVIEMLRFAMTTVNNARELTNVEGR
jgi:hypothetical protein